MSLDVEANFHRCLSVRSRLLLLVLAAFFPAAGLVAWYVASDWQAARDAAFAKVKIFADNTAKNLEDILRDNEAVLGRLAARPLVRALDPGNCDPILGLYVTARPGYSTLAVRDAQANIVCTLLTEPPPAHAVRLSWVENV